jgi:hypothetical protein
MRNFIPISGIGWGSRETGGPGIILPPADQPTVVPHVKVMADAGKGAGPV